MTKITFRGYNRVKFQSLKLGKTVFCSSLLLRDFLLHLEQDKSVQSYELKPFKIFYTLNERRRNIQPHVLVKSKQELCIIWLKSSAIIEEDFELTVRIITNFCETRGFRFAVKFADEIRREPTFSNLQFLRRYNRSEINLEHTILCRKFFDEFSTPLLGDLLRFFKNNDETAETVFGLLSKRLVSVDIDSAPISPDIPIKLENKFPEFKNGRLIA